MKDYKTEQEKFWSGEFGDEYIARNKSAKILNKKTQQFAKILNNKAINSCLELGTNVGLNLRAIKLLNSDMEIAGVEINHKAYLEMSQIPDVKAYNDSILEFSTEEKYDLTFTSGVLIHINPDELNRVYDTLYRNSNRYILICEYYNPTPMEVKYRENDGKLFKRDFAGEFMDKFQDVELVDYGFIYHRDKFAPADDCTWFLMEKK